MKKPMWKGIENNLRKTWKQNGGRSVEKEGRKVKYSP